MKSKKLISLVIVLSGFINLHAQSVKDIDGNSYKAVTIGTQVWMAENLKTTRYNDGTAIPLIKDDKEWAELTSPAYCWFRNDINFKNKFGALYNWYTVRTGKASAPDDLAPDRIGHFTAELII